MFSDLKEKNVGLSGRRYRPEKLMNTLEYIDKLSNLSYLGFHCYNITPFTKVTHYTDLCKKSREDQHQGNPRVLGN